MESDNIPLEHQNVPQAHQGLHGFLYSSDDEHNSAPLAPTVILANSPESADSITPLTDWCEVVGTAKVAGVYIVFNDDRQAQYVGYSRNVALSLRGHATQLGQTLCAFVRVQPFDFPKRDDMEALRDRWIAELNAIPPGNEPDSPWATTVGSAAIAAMSATERQAYDEKKLKLRKAMADGDLSRELAAQEEKGDRAENLEAAVTQDDWSGVVQQQTQETLP